MLAYPYFGEMAVTAMGSTSGFYEYSPVWSDVMYTQLKTGRDYMALFLRYLYEVGSQFGQTDFPVSNEVWDIAAKSWDSRK